MADEKTRVSGEIPRPEPKGPVLPIVNPEADKPQPPKSTIHPAVYVAYVKSLRAMLNDRCIGIN